MWVSWRKGLHLCPLRCLVWKLLYFRCHATQHRCTTVNGHKCVCVCVQLIRCVPWQIREDSPSNCWNTVALPSFMGQDGCALQRGRGRLNALGWLLMKSEDGVCHSAVIKTTSARHTLAHPKMFDCSSMWLWIRTFFCPSRSLGRKRSPNASLINAAMARMTGALP